MSKRNFIVLQVAAFLLMTVGIGTFTYYFPNMPPFLRPFLKKGSVEISSEVQVDERFLEWFNRDPERQVPAQKGIVVAPADGVVMSVKEEKGKKHVVIEMRYSDVHVQRVPISGTVVKVEGEGQALPKGMPIGDYTLDKMMPYQKSTTLKTDIGEVTVRQITSYFAKRILVYLNEGQEAKIGDRLGRILAGSTVVIEMPPHVEPQVKVHQDVLAGETIIARYK